MSDDPLCLEVKQSDLSPQEKMCVSALFATLLALPLAVGEFLNIIFNVAFTF